MSNHFVTKMKCRVTSRQTHDVLISNEISYKSYREICSGEKTKVNLGYNEIIGYDEILLKVENNSLVYSPRKPKDNIYGIFTAMAYDWEVLNKFFEIHNIEPNWLDCESTWGWYDEDLGGWTGCLGKV